MDVTVIEDLVGVTGEQFTARFDAFEEMFLERLDSLEYLLIGVIVAASLTCAAIVANLVMRFFHVR